MPADSHRLAWVAVVAAVAVGGDLDWSARRRAVVASMEREVAASASGHPLADPGGTLGPREILVTTTRDGAVVVDAGGQGDGNCRQKCELFLDQFLSMVAAWRRGACGNSTGLRQLPEASFFFREHSAGCALDAPAAERKCAAFPTLVVAKGQGPRANGTTPGILAPNPYFGRFPEWAAFVERSSKRAALRPLESRAKSVFWRGSARAPKDANATGCDAPVTVHNHSSSGLEARLRALSLALVDPETFDVGAVSKHEATAKVHARELVDWLLCDARRRGLPGAARRDAFARGAARLQGAGAARVEPEDFSRSAVLVSLPGDTHGSFSKHLNFVWVAGSPVLLWRWRGGPGDGAPMYAEWYYAGLNDGETHVEVGAANVAAAARDVLGDDARAARLARAAVAVQDTFLCPCCIAGFYADLLSALAEAQRGFDVEAGLAARDWRGRRAYATHGDPALPAEKRLIP